MQTLYTTYSKADDKALGKGVRLTQCPRCKRFADKYVEHDLVVLFIDLVLIKPQVCAEAGVPACLFLHVYSRSNLANLVLSKLHVLCGRRNRTMHELKVDRSIAIYFSTCYVEKMAALMCGSSIRTITLCITKII